jgi:Short C-terminal domain
MMMRRRGPGLVGAAARTAVVAGTATAVSGRVQRRQQRKYAEQDAEYVEQVAYQGQPVAQAAAGEPEYMAELQQLAELRDQGVLTAEEFDAKKKQILGI